MSGLAPSTSSSGGQVPAGSADIQNPVKVGGRYNASPQILANGQVGDLQLDQFGLIRNHTYFDASYTDAFHRLRTVNPHTMFDLQNQYDVSPLYYETATTGGGTVTHLPNESSTSLNVGTTSGDKVIRQTREYFRYQPGKSQLILMTAVFGATKANVRKRVGYFDANNGLFFEDDGTGFFVVQRSYTSGVAVDTRVAQANFNGDTLLGTGGDTNSSGVTLDLSKSNIFWIDFEWLGVGLVNFGIYDTNGIPVTMHSFKNANSFTTPYMTTANLPMRQEIENTGTSASNTSLKRICSSVITENGGEPILGMNATASNGITSIAITSRRAILSIRPKATFNSIVNRGQIREKEFQIVAGTNNSYFEIVYNPTFTGTPTWTSAGTSSIVEYSIHGDAAAGAITGGQVLASGFAISGQGVTKGLLSGSIVSKLPLTLDINGLNPIAISIVCTSFTGTSNVNGAWNWKEVY